MRITVNIALTVTLAAALSSGAQAATPDGHTSAGVAVADFYRDGDLDAAVAVPRVSGFLVALHEDAALSILLATGAGQFAEPVTIAG